VYFPDRHPLFLICTNADPPCQASPFSLPLSLSPSLSLNKIVMGQEVASMGTDPVFPFYLSISKPTKRQKLYHNQIIDCSLRIIKTI
jgi:hypothetical protein